MNNNIPGTPSLQPFDFQGHAVRSIVKDDGSIWFVASDVCRILEHTNTAVAVGRLDAEDRDTLRSVYTSSNGTTQAREVTIIREGGAFDLVFTSRSPLAKGLKRWLTHEILPSLRKTGVYIVGQETKLPSDMTPEELITHEASLIEQRNLVFAHLNQVYAEKAAQLAAERVRHLEARQDRDEAHVSLKRVLRVSYPGGAASSTAVAVIPPKKKKPTKASIAKAARAKAERAARKP